VLDQYGRPFARSESVRSIMDARERVAARIKARYDAVQNDPDADNHWKWSDGLSSIAAANPEVRRRFRNRARYECQENNSYLKGMILTLANDTIGAGPRWNVQTGNPDADRRIEKAFIDWSDACGLPEKLRTMKLSKTVDGEAFALFTTNRKLRSQVKLDLRLIEAEQITTPTLNALLPNAVDGIEFDEEGNPTVYNKLKYHPGSLNSIGIVGGFSEFDPIAASEIIHLFRVDRPDQKRGITEVAPALPLCAQLRRYTLAVLAAAETAADLAGVLYTDSPALESPDTVTPLDQIPIVKRALLTLPAGWKIGQMEAKQPTTTYEMFKHELLNEIARCLIMPFNIAAGNSEGYNYASGRLDFQTYFKSIKVERDYFERHAMERIVWKWLEEAMLIPGLLPDGLAAFSDWRWQWMWEGWEHVDPMKEASAANMRMVSGIGNIPDEYARLGVNWEEAQIKQAAALGITVDELRALIRNKLFAANGTTPVDQPDETEAANA